MQKPFTQLGQRHNIIRQFTPNWFTVSMGTGVVALIISEFPMLKALTWQLGTGLWYFNIWWCFKKYAEKNNMAFDKIEV